MTTEPVSTADAKAHLRLADDDPGISLLSAMITAARRSVEQVLNASVVVKTVTLKLDKFPCDLIELPEGPVISVSSIAYIDDDGATQTVGGSPFCILKSTPLSDVIAPIYNTSWPSTRPQPGAVTITYTAGMMAGSPLALPDEEKDVWAAILLALGDLWENREGQFVGVSAQCNETLERLLSSRRRKMGI